MVETLVVIVISFLPLRFPYPFSSSILRHDRATSRGSVIYGLTIRYYTCELPASAYSKYLKRFAYES